MKYTALLLTLLFSLSLLPQAAAAQEADRSRAGIVEITQEHTIATREAPQVEGAEVTAFMDRRTLPQSVRKEMETAYKELVFAKTLEKAVPELELPAGMEYEDLTVRELFHAATEETKAVTLTFPLELPADTAVWILRCHQGRYEILDAGLAGKDGSVQAEFPDGLGILAIVTG